MKASEVEKVLDENAKVANTPVTWAQLIKVMHDAQILATAEQKLAYERLMGHCVRVMLLPKEAGGAS